MGPGTAKIVAHSFPRLGEGYSADMASHRPSTFAELLIKAPADRVFGVLANPWSYARWVVGSDKVRGADPDWPAPGSQFEHSVGVWPLKSHDKTYVEECRPSRHLRLRVKARPFVTGRVWLDLTPHLGSTVVRMYEDAADPFSRALVNPLTQPLVKWRNQRALDRLRELAEGEHRMPTPAESKTGTGAAR